MKNFKHINWACDWEHMTIRFREYQRVMEHWHEVLPVPVLNVDYEEMVTDTERVARHLVDWVGLEWDPSNAGKASWPTVL